MQKESIQELEKWLATKKGMSAIIEAKLKKKKKKISSLKTSSVKMKKKLCSMEVLLKSTIARADKVEKEKVDFKLAT